MKLMNIKIEKTGSVWVCDCWSNRILDEIIFQCYLILCKSKMQSFVGQEFLFYK